MIETQLDSLFAAAGHRGRVCVLEIDGPGRVALHADEPTYAASSFKITVGLELWRQCAAGELDPAEPVRITPAERTLGGQGLCLFEDQAELSLRDLARLMLTISDNTATDVVIRRVGPQRVNARLTELGLTHTRIAGTIQNHFAALARDVGQPDLAAHNRAVAEASEAQAAAMRARFHRAITRPGLAPCTSAAEMARLVRMLWRDEAGPADACANLRAMLHQQRLTRKIATGFPPDVTIAAKSGSVPGVVSNDVGAVHYPDGRRYAVAILTTTLDPDAEPRDPPIGTAARIAIEHLRQSTT